MVFIRYTLAGSVAAAVHFGMLWLLVEQAGVYPTTASALGFCAAVFVNYSLQYYWTFEARGPHRLLFMRYVVVTLAMFVVMFVFLVRG